MPCHGKAAGFRTHDGPLDARLPTAFGNGFRKQHNRPNHFVIMLNIVDKVEFVLGKVLRSRHTNSPSARVSRRTTASPRRQPLGLFRSIVSTQRGKTEGVRTIIYYKNRAYCRGEMRKMTAMTQEEDGMATPPRRPRSARADAPTPRREEPTPRKKAGRPKGPPSTIVNLRLPLELLARLDRYIDRSGEPHRAQGPSRDDCPPGIRALFRDA